MNYSKALILAFLMLAMTLSGCTGPTVTVSDVDGDGVIDALDLCPNTPPNTQVNSNGCEEKCSDFKIWDDMRHEFEYFGADVQTDGRSVIVGAPDEHDGGKAFVFRCKMPANGWLLEDELVPTSVVLGVDDNFGHSVSIIGDYAIVGNPKHDIVTSGATISDAGAAFVFKRGSGGLWSEVTMLQEPSPNQEANFGWSVDISANAIDRSGDYDVPIPGTQFNAVVGAPTSNAVTGYMSGAAYFFTKDSVGVEFADVIRLEASTQWHDGSMCLGCGTHSGPWDWGGYGVDVAVYGATVVVGSPIENYQITKTTTPKRVPEDDEWGAPNIL
ncbi:MAG: FG-GAP repeat protein, partial [Anaerolineales bacterium]|nr:FG-GAP repeat protein [Anaerolineales bacterium]